MADDSFTKGTALAAVVLQIQILHALAKTGLISKGLILAMLDAAVLSLEEMPRDENTTLDVIDVARMRLLSVQRLIDSV